MTLPVEASDDPPQATAANGASAGKNDSSSAPASSAKLSRKISISEMASAASTRRFATPKWLSCWLEFPFRIKNNQTGEYVEEATAHAMDYSARGPINQCGSFVGSAMIRVAAVKAMKAGTPTIYGMKPSSVLTVASLIVNISAGVTMPFVGALVDHTDHRKIMGTVSAFIMTAAVAVQIAINEDTWLAVWIFEIIGGYFLIMHQVCTMAYLPDLTHETPEMGHYTARFMIDQYFVQACFTLIIILVSTYWDHKDNGILASTIATARLSAGMATGIGCVLLTYAWTFLFRKRPKLREIPEGSNIFTTGFQRIAVTTKHVFSKYRALRWFLVALLFSPEAGAGVVLSIAVTFLTFYVGMTVTEIAIASIIMLFFNLPGALISKFMCRKVNPLNSFRCAEMCYAMVNALIAGTVSGPEKKGLVYPYAAMAGLAFGWMFPSQRTLTVAIIPKGQETEMMGLISFFGQIMGWLPALLFTIMNENGVDMRWSMSLISYFLATSCCLTFMCGSYEDAVQLVAHTSDEYLKQYSRNSGVDNFFDEEQIKDENDGTDGSGTNTPPSTEGKEDGVVEMA
uniref:Major facilitator superfamily (MFS) profile domain-containing protein n=1 Tax=Skeletonema marinoi TaxID=267567 RepID=A0A7S2KJ80_9STRA|mmetsp:Transcript_13740/g.23056  ORF Transcript_13740/g.23056 Transcript_13740/m.23056 type:complete len:570 (+) Transcript_13740:64-1773(+)